MGLSIDVRSFLNYCIWKSKFILQYVKLIKGSSEVSISASLGSKVPCPQPSHCRTHRCVQHLSSSIFMTSSDHCVKSHIMNSYRGGHSCPPSIFCFFSIQKITPFL